MHGILPCGRGSRKSGVRLMAVSLLAVAGVLAGRHACAAPGVPLAVYGQLPSIEDVALSPDGSRLAYVRTQGDLRIIVVADVVDHKMIRWVNTGDEKLRDLTWADDDNLMFTTSLTTSVQGFKDEWYLLRAYNVSQNKLRTLPGAPLGSYAGSKEVLNTVVGYPMVRRIDGHTVVFVPGLYQYAPGEFSDEDFALFRCDLTTGGTRVERTGPDNESWWVDGEGRVAAQQDYDSQTERWSLSVFHDGIPLEAASGHAAVDAPEILGFGPTSDTVLVQSIENGRRWWRLLSLKDRKLSPAPEADVFDTPLLDPLTDRLMGGMNLGDVPQYVFLDPAWNDRWKSVVQALAGDEVTFVTASSDFTKVVALVDGPHFGYRYLLIDLKNPAAVPIGKVYDGIDKPLEKKRITYAAADGLQIPAYLTLPEGRAPHDLPLIVLVHGGPAAADTAEFDWWSQALADQGYAALQANYRGSDIGLSFMQAGFGQWGRKMQTDLSDGVAYLAKQGTVDPAKVCIVGASYGGYAALARVTLQPTIYRCAVSVAGISDLAKFLDWYTRGGLSGGRTTRYWDRFFGVSGSSDPILATISPIRHVDAVTAPVLLIHGRDDTVVPYEQSQIMYDAMRRLHKDVQLVTLKKEDHWLSRGETRMQMLEATVAFLRAHDPPD
jgi:dipeptidyl aminopeptidase/acylaminoacyl peptidase